MGHLESGVPFFLPMNIIIKLPDSESLHLCVTCSDNVITGIDYVHGELRVDHEPGQSSAQSIADDNDFGKKIQDEFKRYFLGGRYAFSLPCQLTLGTIFQQKVWQALLDIPAGQVTTYGALAKQLNSSPRAVGNACRKNLFPIIVPCHRVVSASGIGGYAGDTLTQQKGNINYLQIKRWLLVHEQANLE